MGFDFSCPERHGGGAVQVGGTDDAFVDVCDLASSSSGSDTLLRDG
jgi:hypothetical protein